MDRTLVDLFCGAGGLAEGFRAAGYSILAGVDRDPDACATFQLNFPAATTICGDLTDPATKESVRDLARTAEVIVGGPPCQAFSQMRNHDRILDDPRNALYKEFIDILRDSLPVAFIMENVPGMAQMRVQEQVAEDLSLEGEYTVSPQLLDACDFGVPQTRERILFVALHKSLGQEPPSLTEGRPTKELSLRRSETDDGIGYEVASHSLLGQQLAARLADPNDLTLVNAEQAISDLDFLQAGSRRDNLPIAYLGAPRSAYQKLMRKGLGPMMTNVRVPRINEDTATRLAAIPEGGNYRDLPAILSKRYISGQKWGPHNGSGKLERRHYYAYRRLHSSIWAWTLNTKADSAYHWSGLRALSVREFARFQSFPDCFEFTTDERKGALPGRIDGGPAHSRYRQAGNAVPPLLARSVAEALKRVIGTAAPERKQALA